MPAFPECASFAGFQTSSLDTVMVEACGIYLLLLTDLLKRHIFLFSPPAEMSYWLVLSRLDYVLLFLPPCMSYLLLHNKLPQHIVA